jgi:hypothetical protein
MPRQYATITLADAKRMLSAAEAKAASLGIAYNIAKPTFQPCEHSSTS